jgi:oleandomycin transport system permease protein
MTVMLLIVLGAEVRGRLVNTVRALALALGGPVEANLLKSIAWLAGIFIVFAPLAVRTYRRAS